MLSRVADSLYWMGRYLERAEHAARLIGVGLDLSLEVGGIQPERWARAMRALNVEADEAEQVDLDQLMSGLLYDGSKLTSVRSYLRSARENARQVREQVSSEMWEELNELYLKLRGVVATGSDQHYEFCRDVKYGVHLLQGVTDATMSYDQGWYFVQLGRYIERASATARLLDVHFAAYAADTEGMDAADYLEWVGLLKSCTAFEAYCKVYTADPQPHQIAEFLLLDQEFPRSVRFAVDMVESALQTIAREVGFTRAGRAERIAGRLKATLDYGQVDEIMAESLHEYLVDVQRQCERIHDAMLQEYIDYPVVAGLPA